MRRLLSSAPVASHFARAKSLVIHTGQTLAFSGVAVLAAASAPNRDAVDLSATVGDEQAVLVAPPVKAEVQPAGPVMRQIGFAMPLKGYAVNSPYGLRKLAIESRSRAHKGVDIAAPKGTTVFATAEGVVLRTGYEAGGYGNFIEVRHPNGMTSLYAHLSRIDVASGDQVAGDQRIGLVGSTGYSTGPHLHFEVRRAGSQVNPSRVVGRTFSVPVKTDR